MALDEDAKPSRRLPVFARPPSDWAKLTAKQKQAWAESFVRALKAAAAARERISRQAVEPDGSRRKAAGHRLTE
jgi:hypothetical protein